MFFNNYQHWNIIINSNIYIYIYVYVYLNLNNNNKEKKIIKNIILFIEYLIEINWYLFLIIVIILRVKLNK